MEKKDLMFKKNQAKKKCHALKKEQTFNQDPTKCQPNIQTADSD